MIRIPGQKQFKPRPLIKQMTGRSQSISPVIAASGQNTDGLSLYAMHKRRHLLGGAMPGILHKQQFREAIPLCGSLINPAHFSYQRYLHPFPSITHWAVAYRAVWLSEIQIRRTPFAAAVRSS